ncbi:hypothetical protein RRG08_022282 [Elysia crispata]|uniref:Uncharacterized protein n=1 Tax=Elysia crispata TaxID=231223 RepID=A0AAE0ZQL6_9GAST|nr:hypothetical protein RRG08_022282 [Elysia crispata]
MIIPCRNTPDSLKTVDSGQEKRKGWGGGGEGVAKRLMISVLPQGLLQLIPTCSKRAADSEFQVVTRVGGGVIISPGIVLVSSACYKFTISLHEIGRTISDPEPNGRGIESELVGHVHDTGTSGLKRQRSEEKSEPWHRRGQECAGGGFGTEGAAAANSSLIRVLRGALACGETRGLSDGARVAQLAYQCTCGSWRVELDLGTASLFLCVSMLHKVD